MKIQELIREFKYNSVKLPDPNPAFTLVQVRDFFANVYPEIISADIEGPEQIGDKQVFSFRRAVGTKGGAGPSRLISTAVQIDPTMLQGRNTITVQQVAVDILNLPATNRKTLADISHQMAKLGWKRGRDFPVGTAAQIGIQNWCFSRDIEPAGVPEQDALAPIHKKISDLAALYGIGWFDADHYSRYVVTQAIVAVELSAPISLVLAVEISTLHAMHCSRSQEAVA